ncbi:MAG: choice-of-anchor J domain-containing protein, partial [Bacteroidota bacterium]
NNSICTTLNLYKYTQLIIAGLFIAGLLSYSSITTAQIRCGTVEYQKLLEQHHPKMEKEDVFEHWLNHKLSVHKSESRANRREQAELIEIPVVVHIIHSGEAIGIGKNVSDAQIISQIEVLNEDFRRTNPDAANTPPIFLSDAADIEVEFTLAQRDPEGLPTNGINRINGQRDVWALADNIILKSLSIWPPEDYLNIWVTAIDQEFLGYAQFPTTNQLGGLANGSSNEGTDGIVIHYRAFGSVEKFPPADLFSQYQLGRTATHEVGHYLGLRHIWGDNSSCFIDDFVADTPPATRSSNGLGSPCSFPGNNTCTSDSPDRPDMFQNYMDFSDDVCMNLFTNGQKDRMRIVLDNSPRRASLANSKGALAPEVFTNDIGIRNILSPGVSSCEASVIPELEIRNYGSNTVSAFTIETRLNGVVVSTDDFNVDLDNLEIVNITISPVSINNNTDNELSFMVLNTNGMTDNNPDNDLEEITISIPANGIAPFSENFDVFPAGWTINDIDEVITWELLTAPKETSTNRALGIDFFNYEIEGELDLFQSPLIDLSTAQDAVLSFDVSYATFPGVNQEGLFITVSTACEDPVFESDTVFFKLGSELATTSSSSFFTPSGQQDWRSEVISLRDFLGEENVRISFIAQNAFGNNLYIDNIALNVTAQADVAVDQIVSPSVVSCQDDQALIVEFKNTGTLKLGYFEINYQINSESFSPIIVELDDSLDLNETTFIELPASSFLNGVNNISVTVSSPNQVMDVDASNNSISRDFIIDNSVDIVPLKETFEDFGSLSWTIANPDGDITWQSSGTNFGTSAWIDLSDYDQIGEQDWLVSPIIDLSGLTQASLNFDYAYSFSNEQNDGLAVLISSDCGSTYFVSDFERQGSSLGTNDFSGLPSVDQDWQNMSISLNDFVGQEDVRIAFVSTNANGNNIFIDNIQIFITEFFIGANNDLFPNPTLDNRFKLLFDLEQRETVQIRLFDTKGNALSEFTLPNTLNQTYEIDMSDRPQGIYLVQVQGESFAYTRRVMNGQ